MMKANSKGTAVLVSALGVALLSGGTAYAFWTTTGTGTGSAAAGSVQPVTVTGTASVQLFPGGKSAVRLAFSNENPFKVTVASIVPSGPVKVTGGQVATSTNGSACDATTAGVVFETMSGSWTVDARSGTTNGALQATVSDAVRMTNDSVTRCQGATFSQAYTFTAQSAG